VRLQADDRVEANEERQSRDEQDYRRMDVSRLDITAMPAPARHPTYCGVCGIWITGLWSHENRCKSHKVKLALIKARINLQRGKLSTGTIVNTHDKPTPDEQQRPTSL
jgi:hypothetical protein